MPGTRTDTRTGLRWSDHADRRSQQRGVRGAHVDAALSWGRCYHQRRGRCAYYVGRREVAQASGEGADIRAFEGTAVVVAGDGEVVTVIKVANPRRLRRAA